MGRTLASALLFQLAWFVCVLVPAPGIVLAVTVLNLAVHARFLDRSARQWLWLAVVFIAGAALDTMLFQLGVLQNRDFAAVPPFWLLCLWLNFAAALRTAFAFLQRNLWLAAALGALAGPASYLSGSLLNGSVDLQRPLAVSLAVLAVVWALLLPLFAGLARRPCFLGARCV
ncbi:DUF2878 domain-containing protein [Microbulbifer sp. SAOS-129_SWC]|uniref:DUF2878 domain-containing protein n=1 Tax=Microbulbifer sp. SAOS-129_SWC TaxID=3145235 RepID=UPI003217CC6D